MSGRFNLNDYVTVDERIDRFWEMHPHGAIRTEMIYTNNDGSSVAIRASVYKDWEHPTTNPDATGIAQEERGGANANKASWWENCETSAIGRALANLGMSISKQRPSREEMAKVQRYQDDERAPQPAQRPQANGSAPTRAPQPPTPQRPPQQATGMPHHEFVAFFQDQARQFKNGTERPYIQATIKAKRGEFSAAQYERSLDWWRAFTENDEAGMAKALGQAAPTAPAHEVS